jgi:hypothetical protein
MLDEPKKFLGTIENFNPASTIELVDTRATRADFGDGVLKLFDHHRLAAALDISGDFLSNQFQINHRHGDTFVTVGTVSSDTDRHDLPFVGSKADILSCFSARTTFQG